MMVMIKFTTQEILYTSRYELLY